MTKDMGDGRATRASTKPEDGLGQSAGIAIAEPDAVQVTAADYAYETFDGCPFTALPQWLCDAVDEGRIRPDTPNCTDYAEWWVKTPRGEVLATPGDMISILSSGGLVVIPAIAMETRSAETTGSARKGDSAAIAQNQERQR